MLLPVQYLAPACALYAAVTRFSKDFRGQPMKSVFPKSLLDPEDPEGPLLRGGVMPEFCVEAQTFRQGPSLVTRHTRVCSLALDLKRPIKTEARACFLLVVNGLKTGTS